MNKAKPKTKPSGPKGGRPAIDIDREQFEKLCGLRCTLAEIAGFFDCSDDTIERWCTRTYNLGFAEVFRQKASRGDISLRRRQMEIAQGGNVTMLIWLGKQRLGQADKREDKIEARVEQVGNSEALELFKEVVEAAKRSRES